MKSQSQIEVLPNGTLLELVKIEGDNRLTGIFHMHEVNVPGFYIGKYPITNQQFLPFLQEVGNQEEEGSNWVNLEGQYEGVRCGIKKQKDIFHCVDGLEHHPMIYVSWHGAKAYCKWLSEKANNNYRLPTKSEWKYAAEGGKNRKDFSHAGSNKLKEVGWYNTNSHAETKPVGLKLPNKLGLYDMSGNVFEWCEDYSNKGTPKDGSAWREGKDIQERVVRGGSWYDDDDVCFISYRIRVHHFFRSYNVGFRIAKD